MSNIIDSIRLSGTTYQIQGSGGGKAIEAGRGITITTGETADTVSFNLPISAGTGTNSIREGNNTTASGDYSHTEGGFTNARGSSSHAEGYYTTAIGRYSHAEGDSTTASGGTSHAEGYETKANGDYSHSEGYDTIASNKAEHASGQYNVSSSASTTFGDSGNTLFSVGNGTATNARHNAFEIRQNGDIYLTKDGQDVKLQDQLGGGTQTIELTQAQYDALVDKDPNTFYIITDAYSPDISAITSAVTSGSTDSEIPTAKAVYTAIPIVTNTITSGSTEAITSGAVYDAIGDIETLLSQI